jgi:excisionase family DNA binding protein
MQVETEQRRLYTIPQVVYQTGYSRSTVYNEIAAGRLRAVKLGRAIRIPAEELDRWIAELSEASR